MLLIVAGEGRELAGVRRRSVRVSRLGWPVQWAWRGELNGQAVAMLANGSGGAQAVEAMRAACEREAMDAVVSTGWCGALEPGLGREEIFVATRVEAAGGGEGYPCETPRARRAYRSGRLLTVDRVAATAAEKARLRATGAAAVDLEAAGLAAEATRRGLRFFCVRVVLDEAQESLGLDFEAARGENGRLSNMKLLRAGLARPGSGVPELVRWAWRSRVAARALGEFMAECSFAI